MPFPRIQNEPIGFYPIVNRFSWIERLVPLGVKTIQLRIKDLDPPALEDEVAKSAAFCSKHSCRLFVNDYWELAIATKAYGVHLGQEDLAEILPENLATLSAAGLRLGISTHSREEADHANRFQPSYIALGPIFETTCKSMKFGPQGFEKIRTWKQLYDLPIVAIGGLKLEHARDVLAHGASGIALISDVLKNEFPEKQATCWIETIKEVQQSR